MSSIVERFSLPLGACDGPCYFIVALPQPSIQEPQCITVFSLTKIVNKIEVAKGVIATNSLYVITLQ